LLPANIIVLQESVYESLPKEVKNTFELVDLSINELQVRDDSAAYHLDYPCFTGEIEEGGLKKSPQFLKFKFQLH
tara:strand:+ start:130 stop:354 length:225 start_codon:yes stop_codon:yes gene_type:complete